ncbi:MAG: D-aminoacyl-tRNA deacylase [Planctomycetota bacterium]
MRVLVQRVLNAEVRVAGASVGRVGRGFLLFVGITAGDGEPELQWMATKIAGLRVFPDAEGRMNNSLLDVRGAALVVSQFTLFADVAHGKRPSFSAAAPGAIAEPLIQRFVELLKAEGVESVAEGVFGAAMEVQLTNDGPVTIWIERAPTASGVAAGVTPGAADGVVPT